MTGTTAITSAVTNIQYLDNIGIQLNWTGTPNGGAVLQVSVDYAQVNMGGVPVVTNAGTWNTITTSADAAPAGSASSFFYNIGQIAAPWIRLVYTNTSSTGTLNAFICGKAV